MAIVSELKSNPLVGAAGLVALGLWVWGVVAPKRAEAQFSELEAASGYFGIEPGESIEVPEGAIILPGASVPGAPEGGTVILVPSTGPLPTGPIDTPAGPATPISVEPGAEIETTETGLEYVLVQYPPGPLWNGVKEYVTVNSLPFLPEGTRIIVG